MARPSRASQAKRGRERAKQEKQQDKRQERTQRKEQKKALDAERPEGFDPDLEGIVPGPQPSVLD